MNNPDLIRPLTALLFDVEDVASIVDGTVSATIRTGQRNYLPGDEVLLIADNTVFGRATITRANRRTINGLTQDMLEGTGFPIAHSEIAAELNAFEGVNVNVGSEVTVIRFALPVQNAEAVAETTTEETTTEPVTEPDANADAAANG